MYIHSWYNFTIFHYRVNAMIDMICKYICTDVRINKHIYYVQCACKNIHAYFHYWCTIRMQFRGLRFTFTFIIYS